MSARPAFEQFTAQPPQPAGEVVTQQAGDPGQVQELTISKLENAITSMEEQGLQNDHRHAKSLLLKQKLQARMPEGQQEAPGGSQQITPAQLAQLKAQVSAYRLLARNEPVPEALVAEAVMLRPKVTTLLPEPYEYPGESESGEKLPYDLMKIFSLHQIRCNRPTTIAPPTGINPCGMLKQRENAIQNRIGLRMKLLCNLPADIPEHMKLKAEIELRSLRLVHLQIQVRSEVMSCMKRDTTLETPFAYRRAKRQSLREARETDYALLNKRKDQRLVYLLQQTDEYVDSLCSLLKQHQTTAEKKKRDDKIIEKGNQVDDEARVHVREISTGKILTGDQAPTPEEIDIWLETHPGYQLVPRDQLSDDEDDEEEAPAEPPEEKEDEYAGMDEEMKAKMIIEKARNEEDEYDQKSKKQEADYYATAHKIKEKVVKQHETMGGGDPNLQLKPYQLKGLEWMVSLYNNNLNGILADEMGLGKTVQTISLLTYLMEVKQNNGPYLVIVPLSTLSNWQLEFAKWAPHVKSVIYEGKKDVRRRVEGQIREVDFNVLMTTYEYVIKEKSLLGKIRWKYMIIDEGHRLKNHNSKMTNMLNGFFHAQHRLLLTGIPLQNKLPELWDLLNFMLPSIFSSCDTFEQWFNAPFATTGEKVELNQEETMLIIRRLQKILRPLLLRRLKKEVESEFPDNTENVVKRSRKEVDYSGGLMSEEQFMKQVGEVEDENERYIADKKRQRKRNLVGPDENDETMDDVVLAHKKKKKDPELVEKINKMLAPIMEYTDENEALIVEPFQTLPRREELPDYFQLMTTPMDFDRINKKIETCRYTTMEEVNDDMELLVNNAELYNEKGSVIVEHSKIILKLWKDQYDMFMAPPKPEEPATPVKKETETTNRTPSKASVELAHYKLSSSKDIAKFLMLHSKNHTTQKTFPKYIDVKTPGIHRYLVEPGSTTDDSRYYKDGYFWNRSSRKEAKRGGQYDEYQVLLESGNVELNEVFNYGFVVMKKYTAHNTDNLSKTHFSNYRSRGYSPTESDQAPY
ncbi:hypothetical protein B9Z55_014820 [Caenorhabditis nigoni]|uniref:Uncharacterized protein n=1 Tax=Caenorhabditis nigoni TaxID=1611254 RepID=A0A2G5U7E6_9PELO|nr:hypothetical protein B9Z55_014820 [Caenorhabditis nigoni]